MERDPLECGRVRALFTALLDGELEPRERGHVEAHLRLCPSCGRVLANLRRTLAGLRGLAEQPDSTEAGAVAERARRAWRERS